MDESAPASSSPLAGPISHAQIRAARAMLDWSIIELAKAARLSVVTIKRAQDADTVLPTAAAHAIQNAFEVEGIRFLPDDGLGEGVRLEAHRGTERSKTAVQDGRVPA